VIVGRPTLYRQEIHVPIAAFYAQEGLTEEQIGERLGVSRQTINTWKNQHPEFLDAIRTSKDEADAQIEKSLFKKALGGDTTACIFWLKNRQPGKWRDKQDIEQHGSVAVALSGKVELSMDKIIEEYADALQRSSCEIPERDCTTE